MYKSPSQLPEPARAKVAEALNARLADGLDLHGQIKVAHWNIKGPQFAALHPLFETFAVSLAAHNAGRSRALAAPRCAGTSGVMLTYTRTLRSGARSGFASTRAYPADD